MVSADSLKYFSHPVLTLLSEQMFRAEMAQDVANTIKVSGANKEHYQNCRVDIGHRLLAVSNVTQLIILAQSVELSLAFHSSLTRFIPIVIAPFGKTAKDYCFLFLVVFYIVLLYIVYCFIIIVLLYCFPVTTPDLL